MHKPWPLAGGREGSPNYAEVIRADGTRRGVRRRHRRSRSNEGDVIRIHTGNGGGYGDPRRRPRELVLDDLRNGFVTAERARAVYGARGLTAGGAGRLLGRGGVRSEWAQGVARALANVFISYRRTDTAGYADWINAELKGRFGPDRVFMDMDSVPLEVISSNTSSRPSRELTLR